MVLKPLDANLAFKVLYAKVIYFENFALIVNFKQFKIFYG